MTTSRISRMLVALTSLGFAAVALLIWVAPEPAAQRLGLEAVHSNGTAVLRSDLGGLFAGMALLCGAAAWTRRRAWVLAAASMLAAIVAGRFLGWVSQGAVGGDIVELAVEIGVLAALAGLARTPTVEPAAGAHRSWRPVTVAAALLPVVIAGGTTALVSPAVQLRIFNRAAQARAGIVNTAPLADDALRVAVCGSSAPLPSAARAKACVAVFAGGKFYVVDVGPESVENLVLWGIPLSSVGAVLLTHFHSDHIGDLGELNLQTWAGGRPSPLAVYGGPGVDQVVEGFNAAYRLDQGYRTAHHGETVMPSARWQMVPRAIDFAAPAAPARSRSTLAFEDGALRVTAIEVDHAPIAPAYAYRFDYKGRSVVITGDLKFHPSLVQAAQGVDLLVSEAIAPHMTRALGQGASAAGRKGTAAIMHDIEDYHMTPEQAAAIANSAHVKLLAFYHLLPAPDGVLARNVFAQGIDNARHGDWTIADDGSLYTLPLGSDRVDVGRIGE
jgi:ribonuclease Z